MYLVVTRKAGNVEARTAIFWQKKPKMRQMRALDDFDLALLILLQEDGLRTADELAREVALSPSAIARRVRRLREEGMIIADRAVVAERVGPFLTAMIDIQLARHGLAEVDGLIQRLSGRPEVQVVLEIAGQMDLALIIAVRGMDGFNAFADEVLADDPVVRRYETRLVKRRRKFTTAWPIESNRS
jgi:Lrp/AsnC family transcriptional regulator, leucine-responsive regulatory protein